MNRSILIVICDFLLVSLLAFSTVDINKVADDNAPRAMKMEIATNNSQVDTSKDKDMAVVMRMALEEERRSRDQLQGELVKARGSRDQLEQELAKTRDAMTQQESQLSEKENRLSQQQSLLSEREKQVQAIQQALTERDLRLQAFQHELAQRDQKVQAFQQEMATREEQAQKLQVQQGVLQQQLAAAQTNLMALNQQLHDTVVQSVVSQEKVAALEDLVKKQTAQSTNLMQQLNDLSRSNQVVLTEKQRLNTELQVAETEKRFAAEQVSRMQDEVKIQREEKAKLMDGVKELATKSGELAREVREIRGYNANSLYSEFVTNRVQARFNAIRAGFFGEASKNRESETVLITDGTNSFALCHVQDTPLTLWEPGTDWETLTGTLARNATVCPIRTLSFTLSDPRVVLMPVPNEMVRRLGCKAYHVSTDPYKFQDAVLVGTRENYYGECRFQVDITTPEYVKLDHSFLKGIFGKFNPSRGDLVFAKTGELLGVMVNGTYCLMLRSFDPIATFQFGQDVRAQRTGATLSALYSQVITLPLKLQ